MKIKSLALLALAILILVGGWANPQPLVKNVRANNKQAVVTAEVGLTKADINVEYNGSFDPSELVVTGSYDKIEYPIVDTSVLGEQELTFKVYKDQTELKVTKVINVVDTVYPEWDEAHEKIILDYEEDYDVLTFFAASDNVDGELALSLEGSYDNTVDGEYALTAVATDSSGNRIAYDFIVEVLPKPEPPKPTVGSVVSYSANTYGAGWCTWWVADQRAAYGMPIPNNWGNAITWFGSAQAQGYATGYAPVVGAIAYFPGMNHVAMVEAVHGDGTITISEMGWNFQAWNLNRRIIPASSASYIY